MLVGFFFPLANTAALAHGDVLGVELLPNEPTLRLHFAGGFAALGELCYRNVTGGAW